MKLRVEDTIVEEAAVTITRSSPRRRKRELDEGLDGLKAPLQGSKESKKEPKDVIKTIKRTVKQEIELGGTQAVVDGEKGKSLQKRRPKPVDLEAEKARAQDTGSIHHREELSGDSVRKPASKRKREEPAKIRGVKEPQIDGEVEDKVLDSGKPQKRKGKARGVANKVTKVTEQHPDVEDDNKHVESETPQKTKRKHKTKQEKEDEAMPLAARTIGLRMYVGAHVSIAKGLQNSITNCHHIGGNAFALFLKSQRKWDNPPLTDESCDAFHSHCHTHKYDAASHIIPHGSYLVNLAQENKDKAKQAYDTFLDDLVRCERLGIKLYNFHPGAASSSPIPEAIQRIANQLNSALGCTKTVTPVLENMAGSGTVIGSHFSDLRDIISHIKPEFKSRIGVCLDTCHSFAAGYDLRTADSFKRVLQDFDDTVGMQYLKALHINDSKAPLGSKKDLHQNIGLGFLGLRAFHHVMNEPRFEGLPLILETPCEKPDPSDPTGKKTVEDRGIWAREIKLLESLIGMDIEGDEFAGLERDLSDKGRDEGEKMLKTIEAREEKNRKKMENGQRRAKGGKARVASSGEENESEVED